MEIVFRWWHADIDAENEWWKTKVVGNRIELTMIITFGWLIWLKLNVFDGMFQLFCAESAIDYCFTQTLETLKINII